MRRLILTLCLLTVPALVQAQIAINPAVTVLDFTSLDQNAVLLPGEANAGQPKITSYQAMAFPLAADVVSGVPIAVGAPFAKSLATALPTANQYRLPWSAFGFTGANAIPACNTLPCPQYTMLLVAIGPNGTSVRGVTGESNPFTSALPIVTLPAGTTGLNLH